MNAITKKEKLVLSVLVPAYNEAAILADNLKLIHEYLSNLGHDTTWEILVINDGSQDGTGEVAESFAQAYENVRVLHHPTNFGLGQALKFGFANSRGSYVITLDVDLSYDVRHIEELLDAIRKSCAKIVLASPYMEGGSIRNVPRLRKTLSILGNRFLRLFVRGHFSTLTSLVRIYDGPFVRSLNLRAQGMDVMPEILHKALVLNARIVEIPARLDWGPQLEYGAARTSSMRLARHVFSTVLSGFIFRPFLFLVGPGILVGIFAAYVNVWMLVHFFDVLTGVPDGSPGHSWSEAFAIAFDRSPHTYIIGFLSAMLTVQLIGMGLLALQSKKYFEELFHLGSKRPQEIEQLVN